MKLEENLDDDRIQLLYKSMEDVQNTIRFADTKAGAILILTGCIVTLLINIITPICNLLKKLLIIPSGGILSAGAVWLHVIIVILFSLGIIFLFLTIFLSFVAISPDSTSINSVDIDVAIPQIFYLCKISPELNLFNAFKNKNGFFKLETKTTLLTEKINKLNKKQIIELLVVELQKLSYIRTLKLCRIKMAISYLQYSFILFTVVLIPIMIYYLYY